MTDHSILRPAPGATIAPGPWTCADDGTIRDADGAAVCVLGDPFEGLNEQAITNGAAILVVPALVGALRKLMAIRPTNWNDGDDPEAEAAWESCADALTAAGVVIEGAA